MIVDRKRGACMDDIDKLKTFQAMAEISRKWVTTLDAKAGFLVAINGALLAFIWTSVKLPDNTLPLVKPLAYWASAFSIGSVLVALLTVFPRIKLNITPSAPQISFYAYVAKEYPTWDSKRFVDDTLSMTEIDLAKEALEQHHAICHIAMIKNSMVMFAARLWIVSLTFTVFSILFRMTG